MAMSPIEKELRTATKLKMDSEETRKQFLKRLVDATLALESDAWESLSEAAQTWANDGITALNNKETVPDFDETDDDKQEEEDVTTSEARTDDETEGKANGEEKKATKKKSGKKPAAKKAEGKSTKKAEAKAPAKKASSKDKEDGGKPRKVGAQTRIKQMILDNPEVTTEELIAKLGKAGFTPTKFAVSTIRSGFLQSLKLVQEAGYLKGIKV